MLADTYKMQLQLNIFEILEIHINKKLEPCDIVNGYTANINMKVAECKLCAEPTNTDAIMVDMILRIRKLEHLFYLL
jgi:hypothetical protein